jgi:hypothetical protein
MAKLKKIDPCIYDSQLTLIYLLSNGNINLSSLFIFHLQIYITFTNIKGIVVIIDTLPQSLDLPSVNLLSVIFCPSVIKKYYYQ